MRFSIHFSVQKNGDLAPLAPYNQNGDHNRERLDVRAYCSEQTQNSSILVSAIATIRETLISWLSYIETYLKGSVRCFM